MGSYDEDNVKMRRKLVDESLRVELKLKSIIIGIIILLATVYFVPSVKLLSTISVIYLAICLIDIYGIITRYKIMKLYDEDFKINIQLRNAQKFGYYFTSSMGLNTFMYIVLNTVVLMLLVKYMI